MKIIILGAGPAGVFLAHRLLALSPEANVQLYDCNPDPTFINTVELRGFGLGLGARIQQWLNGAKGLKKYLLNEGIELEKSGLILISRRQLCAAIVRSLRQLAPKFSIRFDTSVIDVNLAQHEITIEHDTQTETVAYDLLVGADGIRSIVRTAMMQSANPIQVQQQQRPQVWKVLQLPIPSALKQTPQIIRLQTRQTEFGLVFGACLPQKSGQFSALIFWQPVDERDRMNPCGIRTIDELQQLWQDLAPKSLSTLELDRDAATAFLEAQPGHEYWSKCDRYHDLEGRSVLIGDAAHGMYSLLGQGCTAAIADAVVLSSLIQQHLGQESIVLSEYSRLQVQEGHAASDLSLLSVLFYHRWLGLIYKISTLVWVAILRQPSIFGEINRVTANYVQLLRKNRFWVWLARQC